MQVSSFRLTFLSILLAAAAAPAMAGNYAEGDPRPVALTSSTTRDAVAISTRAWMVTAPSAGYAEGDPRPVGQVGQSSRAVVQADTMNWIKSGLASVQYGEAGADRSRPAYLKAARAYANLRGAGQDAQTSQAPAAPGTVAR